MNSAELVESTLRRLGQPRNTSLASRLHVLIADALRLLPETLKKSGEDIEIYRKAFTVTLASGQGSLSSHTNLSTEPMLPADIVKVTHADVVTADNSEGKLQRVGSESALNGQRSTAFVYFAVEDNTLYTMMNNDREALGGTANVRAGFVPQLSSVKFQHQSYLVDCMVRLVGGVDVNKDLRVPNMAQGQPTRARG